MSRPARLFTVCAVLLALAAPAWADVSRDQAAARDMVRRSGQMGVPVIDIGGKIVVGFNRPQINTLLGIK